MTAIVHRATALAAILALTAACGSAAAPATPAPPAAAGVAIDIQGFKFPATLEVAKGAKVTWTNKDNTRHTVTSGARPNKDGKFDGQGDPAGAFSLTFTDAGTLNYLCSVHSSMNATITVK